MRRTLGVCVRDGGRGEKGESAKGERESEREAGGSWRNIKEGGIEEECVMGREKRRRKEREYIFFLFYARSILILCFYFHPSVLRLIPFLSEKKRNFQRELPCALSPAPAIPFPGFLSALTLLCSAYFLHVSLNSKSCLPLLPLPLCLSLSPSPKQRLEIERAGRQQRASGREQESRRGQGDKKGRERC